MNAWSVFDSWCLSQHHYSACSKALQSSWLQQDFLCEEELQKWPWSPGGSWLMVECGGQRKAPEWEESSTQRLCQGNDNLLPFSWLKSSLRPAIAASGVASFCVVEVLSSSGHAGAPQKSGSGCAQEQMDLLPPSAAALPGAGPALSRLA